MRGFRRLSRKESASFLKKRLPAWGSKKLSLTAGVGRSAPEPAINKVFLLLFVHKKKVFLPSFCGSAP
jgi:hypothetical protein